MDTPRWYVASLIMASRVGDAKLSTVEEQVRLIQASSDDEAYEKALKLGEAENHEYNNINGELVRWEFIGLEDLEELDGEIQDGVEIRYRFYSRKEPKKLVSAKSRLSIFLASQNRAAK